MTTLKQFFASRLIRHQYGNNDRKRDAGLSTPDDITRYNDILYGDDEKLKKWQYLDVYRPKNSVKANGSLKKLPVIISVHGGAWVYGNKDIYQFYTMNIAQRGFAVVNFSYRLAPEAKFPSSMQDTEKVFQFVADNAEQYGFDTENVFAVGDSAGGHLLSLYTAALTNKDFQKNFPFIKDKNLTLRGVGLNCGKYTLSDKDRKFQLLRSGYLPNGGTKEEVELVDSAAHVTKDFPPSFVMTCKGDFLKEQSTLIKQRLDAEGVKNEYHCYGTDEKPLWHVFHCNIRMPEAIQCNDEECNFFRSLIK